MSWDSKRGTWAPPAVVSTLRVMSTAAGNARDPDHVIPSLLPPGQLPRPPHLPPPRAPGAVDRWPMPGAFPSASPDKKAAAASDLDLRIWASPAVTTLPISGAIRIGAVAVDCSIPAGH